MDTDKDHMHFLIRYDTTDRVCDIVKIVKQETTYYLWQKYGSFLSKQYWKKRIFWSDGYFACSIGEASSAIIQKYIESQDSENKKVSSPLQLPCPSFEGTEKHTIFILTLIKKKKSIRVFMILVDFLLDKI